MFSALGGGAAGGSSALSEYLVVPLQAASVLGANVAFVLKGVGTEIGGLAAQASAFLTGNFAGARFIGQQMTEDAKKARTEFDALEKRLMQIGRVIPQADYSNEGRGRPRPEIRLPGGSGGRGSGGGGRSAAAQREITTEAQRYLESLQKQLQGTQDLSVAETVLADIQAGRLKLAKGESAQPLLAVAAEIDAAKRRADQLKAEADQVRDLTAAKKQLADEGARVFEATHTPRERLDADLARTRELFGKGAIDTETYAREVNRLNAAFDELGEKKEVVQELDDFTVRAAQNIQDALGEELTNVLQGNFRNIGDSFKRTLDRMVAEALAADIARALFGNLTKAGGGGGGGGLFGNLLNIGASFFGGGSGGPGINGGSMLPNSLRGGASEGTNALERDMILLAHKGESITPAKYNPFAGGKSAAGMTVNNYFTISGAASRETQNQVAVAAGQGLQRSMARFG